MPGCCKRSRDLHKAAYTMKASMPKPACRGRAEPVPLLQPTHEADREAGGQGGGPPGHASAAPVQVGRGRQQARDALRRGRRGGAAGQARAAGAAGEAGPAVRMQVRQQRPGGSLRLQRVRARAQRQRARRAVLLRGRLRPGRAGGRAVSPGLPALLPSSGAGGCRHSALLLGSAAELCKPGVHGMRVRRPGRCLGARRGRRRTAAGRRGSGTPPRRRARPAARSGGPASAAPPPPRTPPPPAAWRCLSHTHTMSPRPRAASSLLRRQVCLGRQGRLQRS